MTDALDEPSTRFVAMVNDGGPNPTVRALGIALALASQARSDELTALYVAALKLGVSRRYLVEGALSAHLFAGIPRAIEGFEALHRAGGSVPTERDVRSASVIRADGIRLFERIYGAHASTVRSQLAAYAPDFHDAVLESTYGRILSRPVLDAATRELMAICALATLGLTRQLFSHLRGAIAVGARREDCEAMLGLAATLSETTKQAATETAMRAFRVDSQQEPKP